jgi:hypothetical protein
MGSTLTTFDAFLKTKYDEEEVVRILAQKRPLLAKLMVGRDNKGSGNLWVVPAVIGNPQGAGATLTAAQAASTQTSGGNLRGIKWTVAWGDYDCSVDIGDKVIAASKDNVGAFFENEAAEIEGLHETFGNAMATYVYSDAGRSLTPGGFTESGGVCTLVNADDIANISIGMILNASANTGTSTSDALLGSGSNGYVVAINSNAGTFTVSTTSGGTAGTPSGWTSTMYAFRAGDFGGTSTPTRVIYGLGAWVPQSDPSGTAFEGVVRTVATTALSGVRLAAADYAGLTIDSRLKKLATRMSGRVGGPGPTDIVLNPEKWQVLADILESKGTRPLDGKIGTFGYQKLELTAGGNKIDVWSDRACPVSLAYALNLDYIALKSLDGFPAVVNGDGLTMLRKTTTNDYEYRLKAYPALCVRAPGFQGTVPV